MKHIKRLFIAALCLALVLCMALPALAEDRPALTANMTEITLLKGQSKDVTLTYALLGRISVKWDNAYAVSCKMSGVWDGNNTTMTVKGLNVGKATVTLTDSETDGVLKIKVTVTDGKAAKSELSTLMGKTVKAANKAVPRALKAARSGYDNGYFSVKRNSLRRIKSITLYGGKGSYRLFSVYPGLKLTEAVARLKKQGWKRAMKSAKGDVYLSSGDPSHAIRLVKSGAKVGKIIYYIP